MKWRGLDTATIGKVLLVLLLGAIAGRLSAGTTIASAAINNVQGDTMSNSEATGYSTNFSFDEAFKDAMKNLPKSKPSHPDELTRITVEETGAELGGIAGFRRLFVRIKASTN